MLIEFPVELPEDLLEELDCAESDTQFAAFCVDMGHERVLRWNGVSIRSCPNDWVFIALLCYPPLVEWSKKNKVRLGNGVDWLIYDYRNRVSYVADDDTTRRCLETQTLPEVKDDGRRRIG